jgi:hypothetical protein
VSSKLSAEWFLPVRGPGQPASIAQTTIFGEMIGASVRKGGRHCRGIEAASQRSIQSCGSSRRSTVARSIPKRSMVLPSPPFVDPNSANSFSLLVENIVPVRASILGLLPIRIPIGKRRAQRTQHEDGMTAGLADTTGYR